MYKKYFLLIFHLKFTNLKAPFNYKLQNKIKIEYYILIWEGSLFKNRRFMLDEMFKRNAPKVWQILKRFAGTEHFIKHKFLIYEECGVFTRQNSMSWMNKVMAVFLDNTTKILVFNKAALYRILAENRQIGVNLGANWRSPYWRVFSMHSRLKMEK